MKNKIKTLLAGYVALLSCTSMLAACGNNDRSRQLAVNYVSKDGNCIVSLPNEYDIVFEREQVESQVLKSYKDLNKAQLVNGKYKKYGMRYYEIPNNAQFRILTPLGVIYDKRANNQTLVHWQLDDRLYSDGDNYYSNTIFACAEDTEITPVYCEFRTVGMLIYPYDVTADNGLSDKDFFNPDGSIKEQDGVYSLYGVYDFEPDSELWRTNLTLSSFLVTHHIKIYQKDYYTVTVQIDAGNVFDGGDMVATPLCKIDGHGYILYGSSSILKSDRALLGAVHNMSIGEHTLKYSFVSSDK